MAVLGCNRTGGAGLDHGDMVVLEAEGRVRVKETLSQVLGDLSAHLQVGGAGVCGPGEGEARELDWEGSEVTRGGLLGTKEFREKLVGDDCFKGLEGISGAGSDSLAVLPFLLQAFLETGVGCLWVGRKGRGKSFEGGVPAGDFVGEPALDVVGGAKEPAQEGDTSGDLEAQVVADAEAPCLELFVRVDQKGSFLGVNKVAILFAKG